MPQTNATTALALAVVIAGSFNSFNDEIVPQPTPAVVESGVQIGERALQVPLLKQWEFTEELPGLPQPLDHDYHWSAPALVAAPAPVRYFWGDDEIVTAAAAFGVDEVYWLAPAPALVPPVVRYFWFNDEITQAPSSSAYDETSWGGQRKLHAPELKLWEVADDLPQPAVDFIPDQEDAFIVAAIGADPLPMVFAADDEIVPSVAPLAITEPEWQVYSPAWQAPRPLYLPDPEQAVPTPAAPLAITEPEWQVYSPAWLAPQPLYLPDPEQAVPASLSIVEPEWQVYTPPWPAPQPLYLPDPEQAVPKSLLIDEMYWAVYTPPLVAKVARVWYSEDEYGSFIEAPIYGWGARGRIGRTNAIDPWSRIGSDTAVDPNRQIGTSGDN